MRRFVNISLDITAKKQASLLKNLAGIKKSVGVQAGCQPFHEPQGGRIEFPRKIVLFGDADTVFAREGAAEVEGFIEQELDALGDFLFFGGIAGYTQEIDMEVAVAGVAIAVDSDSQFLGQKLDKSHQIGQF